MEKIKKLEDNIAKLQKQVSCLSNLNNFYPMVKWFCSVCVCLHLKSSLLPVDVTRMMCYFYSVCVCLHLTSSIFPVDATRVICYFYSVCLFALEV